MKKIRLLAILLLLAFAFSALTACDVIMGTIGGTNTEEGDNNTNEGDTPNVEKPDDEKPDDGCTHIWVNGTCSECNEVCTHEWVSGTCGICNNDCDHTWVDGVCSTCNVDCAHLWGEGGICTNCGNECEHNFQNGECTVCHKPDDSYNPGGDDKPTECEHNWIDGVCSVCNTPCEHDFDPKNDYTCTICGVQALVPPECKHEWVDGICKHCGNECEHDFGFDITCSICGEWLSGSYILLTYDEKEYKVRYESTLAEFISEHLGTTYEATVANGSYWMALDPFNLDKINLEADTPLNQFGACFELYYIDCTPPPVCEHEWVGDYCPKCGRTCDHSYSDSVCTICGTVCSDHYFSYGSCMYCGKTCEHEWSSDYRCEKCDLPCDHPELSKYGYCSVCGYECLHSWNLTECQNCGFICNHEFDGPYCIHCGYMSGGIDNPLTIYFEDTVYTTPYSASFQELFYLYSDFSHRLGFSDYEESIRHGYWVVVTDQGDVRIGEYTSLCEFGHYMTIAFRTEDVGGEGGGECTHPYYIHGVCEECGAVCQHNWVDGFCQICYMRCEHGSWNGSICDTCGSECEHYYSDGNCVHCGTPCQHEWVDGNQCNNCGLYCEHYNYQGGLCTVCGKECPHDVNWFYGTCVMCGYQCEHRGGYDENGRCYTCYMECPHSWNDDTCLNCGVQCQHTRWENGVCTKCGRECRDHSWMDTGYCHVCNKACEHHFENDQCVICLYTCYNHIWNGETCEICGAPNPDYGTQQLTALVQVQDYPGSDSVSTYYIYFSYDMPLYELFDRYYETEDGKGFYLSYESNFTVRLNGTSLDDDDMWKAYITDGADILIYRSFVYEIEIVENGYSRYITVKHPRALSGALLIEYMEISASTADQITVNGMYYDYDMFVNTVYPEYSTDTCYIRYEVIGFSNGTVRLEIYEEGYSSGYYEEIGELNIANFISAGDDFGDFLWTLEYPNGEIVDLETLEMTLFFDPSYTGGENGATVYKLHKKFNVFWVNLQIDDQPYEPLKFSKSDNLTVRDILFAFGFYGDTESYDWHFNTWDESWVGSLDDYVYSDLTICAYDNRPYIELSIDGKSYKAYHTETLTLADAIDLINRVHGTSITFDGYIWYAYSNDYYRDMRVTDPYTFIVVEPGYSRTATAKTLNEIEVFFTTDFGPINDEIGMQSIIIRKDSTWVSPEIAPYIFEMANGFVTFTGGFEYRVEEKWEIVERYDVNSIEELFALNLESVTLHAKYEVNYSKICGTYVNYNTILVITESTISKFDKEYGYFGEAKEYKVSISGGYPSLRALDGSFEYMTNILTYEYTKIEDGGFCAVVRMPDGWSEMYTSYDEYLHLTEWANIDYVTDKDGGYIGEVSESGLYFVYASEKPSIEEY